MNPLGTWQQLQRINALDNAAADQAYLHRSQLAALAALTERLIGRLGALGASDVEELTAELAELRADTLGRRIPRRKILRRRTRPEPTGS